MNKAKKTKVNKKIDDFINEKIIQENLEDIFGDRFGRYSKYIIQDRAIPDVRDGLKPVQRRILYAMYKLGMFSNKPFKKSARIVGEVIGKYHPHGDTSVYDAMVRMSQDFKTRLPLIEMHGNNGSIDGDSAAAMRYTEARLSIYSEYLLEDINKKTVGFVPNFDDEEYEPTVLPAKFPNLFVNGASGISAGYATEIPPHNIGEIIEATIYKLDHPDASLKDLLKIVQGPDFPTGGIVQGIDGIINAYKTGRGKIIVKAKTEIVEEQKINKLIITEIPYDVNKANLVKKMSEVYVKKNIDGILDVRDETDREGLRIVVDIRKDVNPEDIRNFFFQTTELQINYHFNIVAIANKRPLELGLSEYLDYYIIHQKDVVINRSNFELNAAKKRLHIVDGLISMVSILDAVIRTIRNSNNKKDAIENLVSNYEFTYEQAEAIVMLQLYRLTNTDIFALQKEKEELNELINRLTAILSSEDELIKQIKSELQATLKKINVPRKTVIESEIEDVKVEVKELIAKEDVVVMLTKDGYIKRLTPKAYANGDETKLKDGDFIVASYEVTTLDVMLFFTDRGNYVYLPVSKIPDVKHKDLGYHISTLVNIEAVEKIIFSVPIDDFDKDRYLLLTTKNGFIKRTHVRHLYATRYSRALRATKLRDDDVVVSVDISSEKNPDVVVVTADGYINKYSSSEIPEMAVSAVGVKAIELKSRPKDRVVGGHYFDEKDLLVVLSANNSIKRFRYDEIIMGRKNNVGKQYITMMKTVNNNLISSSVIHKKNANLDLDSYINGEEGYEKLDFSDLRTATSATGKKINSKKVKTPISLVIVRNNNDLD
jgi:topoisomerase-4 subunit A